MCVCVCVCTSVGQGEADEKQMYPSGTRLPLAQVLSLGLALSPVIKQQKYEFKSASCGSSVAMFKC